MTDLSWDEFAAGAQACGWVTYAATTGADGRPHVAVVSPGFEPGVIWFGTRPRTTKAHNLRVNADIAFHWPVGGGSGPGECFARGVAIIHDTPDQRRAVWESGVMPFDLSQFFGSPENDDHLFVRTEVTTASILGPDFVRRRWTP